MTNDPPDITIDDINAGDSSVLDFEMPEPPKRPARKKAEAKASHMSGLNVAAHAAGLEHHRALMKEYERSVREARRLGQSALVPDPNKLQRVLQMAELSDSAGEEEDGIHIRGDTHINVAADASRDVVKPKRRRRRPQTPTTPQPAPQSSVLPWVLALTGLGGTLAAGGALVGNILSRQPPAAVQPDTDTTERTTIGLSTGDLTE